MGIYIKRVIISIFVIVIIQVLFSGFIGGLYYKMVGIDRYRETAPVLQNVFIASRFASWCFPIISNLNAWEFRLVNPSLRVN